MKPVIIAECCQTTTAARDSQKRMIHEAVNGADYAKIQGDSFQRAYLQDLKKEKLPLRVAQKPHCTDGLFCCALYGVELCRSPSW
ncbi:MAG: hypothetical protein R3B93_28635 [Bacteroidia bacterium]